MSKAQELVDYLNDRIVATGYNARQVTSHRVHFSVMQGPKFARIVQDDGAHRSSYAFVDAEGNIYKCAGWKAPAKGVRATVDQVVSGGHPFFNQPFRGFDVAAYSTGWLYK